MTPRSERQDLLVVAHFETPDDEGDMNDTDVEQR